VRAEPLECGGDARRIPGLVESGGDVVDELVYELPGRDESGRPVRQVDKRSEAP